MTSSFNRSKLPMPESPFQGKIGKTYQESEAAWPELLSINTLEGLLRSFGDLSADSVWKLNSSVEAGSDHTHFYQNCIRAAD